MYAIRIHLRGLIESMKRSPLVKRVVFRELAVAGGIRRHQLPVYEIYTVAMAGSRDGALTRLLQNPRLSWER